MELPTRQMILKKIIIPISRAIIHLYEHKSKKSPLELVKLKANALIVLLKDEKDSIKMKFNIENE